MGDGREEAPRRVAVAGPFFRTGEGNRQRQVLRVGRYRLPEQRQRSGGCAVCLESEAEASLDLGILLTNWTT